MKICRKNNSKDSTSSLKTKFYRSPYDFGQKTTATTLVILCVLIISVDACSKAVTLNAQSNQCEMSYNNTQLCTISNVVRLVLVPQEQKSCLLIN